MITDRNIANNAGIFPGKIMGSGIVGAGEVFYVCKTADAVVYDWLRQRVPTGKLFPCVAAKADVAINAALAACVEGRNDYVIVMPSDSDYDLTAAITISKKSVHLICPAGLGNEIGATNACRLHQNTASTACIAIADSSVEVAGFYCKNVNATAAITIATGCYAPNVHHNTCPLIWTSGAQVGAIICSGDGGAWGSIERNWMISQSGGACTCAAGVIVVGSAATAARVRYNEITIGDTQIATIGISNAAVKGRTDYNIFSECGGAGVADGGTITKCISIHASGAATGNRCNVGTGQFATGGTASHSFNDNMDAVTEGTGGITAQLEA